MQKWLVPTDGSSSALHAVGWAARMGKLVQGGVEITLLAVIEDTATANALMFTSPDAIMVDPHLIESLAEQARLAAQDALDRSLAEAQREGVSPQTQLERGSARQVICDVAAAGGYDLTVMGSRGLGGFAGMVLGSVSHHVVQHAATPVLIVR